LLPEDFTHSGVAVAEGVDGDASGKVEVPPVFNVPEVAAFAFSHHGGRTHVGRDHKRGVFAGQGGGGGVGGRVRVWEGEFFLRDCQYIFELTII